jgi:hypothetical protein
MTVRWVAFDRSWESHGGGRRSDWLFGQPWARHGRKRRWMMIAVAVKLVSFERGVFVDVDCLAGRPSSLDGKFTRRNGWKVHSGIASINPPRCFHHAASKNSTALTLVCIYGLCRCRQCCGKFQQLILGADFC